MPLKLALFGALLVLAALRPTEASAQSTAAGDGEARSLFEAGALAFSDTRYEQALARFEEAYELSGRPELLYNIALSHDRLGNDEPALTAFRRYLEALPEAENRAEVEQRIEVLARRLERTSAPPSDPDPGPWIVVGSGAVVAIAGAILLGVGAADVASVQASPDGTPWRDVAGAAERGVVLEGVGIAGLAAGAVLAGVGVAWALTTGPRSSESASLRLGLGTLALEGTF